MLLNTLCYLWVCICNVEYLVKLLITYVYKGVIMFIRAMLIEVAWLQIPQLEECEGIDLQEGLWQIEQAEIELPWLITLSLNRLWSILLVLYIY